MLQGIDRSLKSLFALNIAFALCYYLVGPLFPLYLDSLQVSESQIGLILGLGSLTGAFSTLISGFLADKFGKKTLFIASVLFNSTAVALIAYTRYWGLIIPLWMVFNLSQSLFEPARLSYIAEKTTPDNRAKLYGIMNLAWPIAGMIGPVLSGKLAENLGWPQVFIVGVVFCLSGLVPLFSIEKSSTSSSVDSKSPLDKKYVPTLALHFTFHVFLTTALGIMNMTVPIYLASHFELNYSTIGLFFTTSGVITMLTQVPSGAIADKYGMKRTTLVILALVPFTYLTWVLIDNWVVLLVAYALSMGLWSMTWGATTVLVSEAVPETMRGTAISARMTGYRVGYTLGPIISGILLSSYGGVTPFIAAMVIFALALPIGFRFKEVEKNTPIPTIPASVDD